MQGLLQTFFFQKSFFFQNSDFFQYLFFSIINFFLQNSIFFHGQRRALHLEGNKTDIISVRAGSTSLPLVLSIPPPLFKGSTKYSSVFTVHYIFWTVQYRFSYKYIYLPIYLPTYLLFYLSFQVIYLSTQFSTYLSLWLSTLLLLRKSTNTLYSTRTLICRRRGGA